MASESHAQCAKIKENALLIGGASPFQEKDGSKRLLNQTYKPNVFVATDVFQGCKQKEALINTYREAGPLDLRPNMKEIRQKEEADLMSFGNKDDKPAAAATSN